MSPLTQLKLLVSLAQIDGDVADREKIFVRNIGVANGLTAMEIDDLFEKQHEVIVPEDLSDDEKFNFIFSLVQLMKIDERLYQQELVFCSQVAARLGYDQQVMFELMLHVKAAAMAEDTVKSLRELTQSYLRKQ